MGCRGSAGLGGPAVLAACAVRDAVCALPGRGLDLGFLLVGEPLELRVEFILSQITSADHVRPFSCVILCLVSLSSVHSPWMFSTVSGDIPVPPASGKASSAQRLLTPSQAFQLGPRNPHSAFYWA